MERKCAECKKEIEIDRNNIIGILQFQGKYYHSECFQTMATRKASSKRGKSEMWQDALNKIEELEANTRILLEQYCVKNDLNEYLLAQYDIAIVPKIFWQRIADLEQGIYKGNKCKPVSIKMLLGAWKWGQQKLNEIDKYNKRNHKGPTGDIERIMYDLSIIITKIPQFMAWDESRKAKVNELAQNVKYEEVDMSKIGQKKQITKENTADIFNDLYVE